MVKSPVAVAASAVPLPVTSAGVASIIPAPGRGNNFSRLEFKKEVIETSKGTVHYAAVALDVAASLTQNVPYLGAISKVLVEISKIADEVEVCKSSWKTVTSKIKMTQRIIDDFRECCSQEDIPDFVCMGLEEPGILRPGLKVQSVLYCSAQILRSGRYLKTSGPS
ncbi:hypothetical protein GGX14DRAFT_397592 [Mycena pura]|uniref:Uncharacterized protein n=1 Tax=Mycena pura TaxID=153505 RepID=A0AAD6VC48_9AGAR|nr:hypothetical protein GGX14DRAFT_397592 [Mycena pura]